MKTRRFSHKLKASPASGTTTAKRSQRESVPSTEEVVTVPTESMVAIVEVVDENAALRYKDPKPHVSWSSSDANLPDYPTRVVYVRRPRIIIRKPEPPPPHQGILLPVDDPEEALEVYHPATGLVEKTSEAIRQEVFQGRCEPQLKQKALASQEASLESWRKALQNWNTLREHVVQKTGRGLPGSLLGDRLVLPPIQNHRAPSLGPESDFPQCRQKERFFNKDAFFLLPEHLGPEDDSLVFSLPWSQRQLYKPPVAQVLADLGEQPQARDKAAKTPRLQATKQELTQLKVTGQKLRSHEDFEEEKRDAYEWEHSTFHSNSGFFCPSKRGSRPFISEPCGARLHSPYYVPNTVPAFRLGGFTYVWGQPCLKSTVEVGVVSNAGEQGLTHIHLANVGCCVMRYSWRRLPHHDHFTTGRYRLSPFIFNSADGSLLPEEKLSLPVHFFSKYAGCWSERWMFRTTPCVTSGGGGREEISLSLWGQAVEVDINLPRRQQLDKELMDSAMLRTARRYARDLVKLLPIRSTQEQPQVSLDPVLTATESDPVAAFERLNPGLHYHSAAMEHLTAARHDLMNERRLSVEGEEQRGSMTESSAIPSRGSKLRVSPSGPDKDKARRQRERSPKTRKGSLSNLSSSSSSKARQRSLSRMRKSSSSCPSAMSSSIQLDDLKIARRPVNLGPVLREAYALDEDVVPAERKEGILQNINLASMLMSVRPFTPPMRHRKHLLVRAGLSQLFDRLARLEWRLCRDLGLLDDPRFQRLGTFPENPPYGGAKDAKKNSIPKERKKRADSRKFSVKEDKEAPPEPEPIDWEEDVAVQYHEKLTAMVHELLASTLESLLPLVTCDGYCLNLLQPPPEV